MHEEDLISYYLNKNGSDKCARHSYAAYYDPLFASYDRNAKLDILESGVEFGGSLCAWKEYFPNARVTGVDVVDVRRPVFKIPQVEFVLSDIKEYNFDRKFDIIIEDGNHSNNDALWAAINLPKHLKTGGSLIIEDVQEGFLIPALMWGKVPDWCVVNAIDMRRITNQHDNFLIIIQPWKVE